MSNRVLVLNSWYFPVSIINWEDAICSIYLEKSEVLASYSETVSSPSVTMKLPAVIRQKKEVRRKRAIKFSRQGVYLRDAYTCQYCSRVCTFNELSYDHLIPRSKGGRTEWTNIVACCKPCNAKKGSKTCDEAGMYPINIPVKPKTLKFEPLPIAKEHAPREWLDWVK